MATYVVSDLHGQYHTFPAGLKRNDRKQMKSEKPIYYTQIEYREYSPRGLHSILLLNTVERQLSYQTYRRVFEAPAITEERNEVIRGMHFSDNYGRPARVVRSWKNGWKKQFLPTGDTRFAGMKACFETNGNAVLRPDWRDCCFGKDAFEVSHSVGIEIPSDAMTELLNYCDARDFEPYRDRKMDSGDQGVIGYRDEVNVHFTAITDSYIPKIVLPMDYYYDEEHIWPSEKLYRYLVKTFFPYDKKKVGLQPAYGASSLFMWR